MSRIGKRPIPLPQGVEVNLVDNEVEIKGPKGTLKKKFPTEVNISLEENMLKVTRPTDQPRHRAFHGLTRAILANMVEGVVNGYAKNLELVGVGYRAQKQGQKLILNVGYSHPVEITPEDGLEIEVSAPTKIAVKGIDKEKVGNLAAKIRAVRPPEPYKGKGIKYEGERIRRKEGKTKSK